MKITQVFCSGMPYMNHLVSHTALPEAGASKNLPLQTKELRAIRGSVPPDGIARGRAVAPRSIQGSTRAALIELNDLAAMQAAVPLNPARCRRTTLPLDSTGGPACSAVGTSTSGATPTF